MRISIVFHRKRDNLWRLCWHRLWHVHDFVTLPYRVFNKTPGVWKKSCSLNITAMILKTVLFYSQLVIKLGSVIYPALFGHSFPSKWENFCRKPLSKACKYEWKHQEKRKGLFVLTSKNSNMLNSHLENSQFIRFSIWIRTHWHNLSQFTN